MLKNLSRRLFGRKKAKKAAGPLAQLQIARQQLAVLRGTVETVIDVGVWRGTPALYEAFADCRFVLVDPQSAGEKLLTSSPKNFTFVNKGLGSEPGKLIMHESLAKSTLHARTPLSASDRETDREVDLITLDQLFVEQNISGRVGLKIDTEGHEIEIIRGLDKFCDNIEFVICEVSVRDRFFNSYNFSELVEYFHARGFRFYNFMNRPVPQPRFYDVIFLKNGHVLFK